MRATGNFHLPLMASAQPQKHLLFNEAIKRLDHILHLRIVSDVISSLPEDGNEGDIYYISDKINEQQRDKIGYLAVWDNGGYIFIEPQIGWAAYIENKREYAIFDGSKWQSLLHKTSYNGASTQFDVLEFDCNISNNNKVITDAVIPSNSVVIGVSARVLEDITGTDLASWAIGVDDDKTRYGKDLYTLSGGFARGLTASPLTYYDSTPIVISPNSGSLTGGKVRIAIHTLSIFPPLLG